MPSRVGVIASLGTASLLASRALGALGVPEVQAGYGDSGSYAGVAMLSGTELPQFAVSDMKTSLGDWSFKPVYRLASGTGPEGDVSVVGILATLDSPWVGMNIVAVYYSRDAEATGGWSARAWCGSSPWGAVASIKAMYGIPDSLDVLWDVQPEPGAVPAPGAPYTRGFHATDPIASAINALECGHRGEVLEALVAGGHAAAQVPVERESDAALHAWLLNRASYFEAAIGKHFVAAELDAVAAGAITPLQTGDCLPRTEYGEWVPSGTPCQCETDGPWSSVCGTFTANAEGVVELLIPFPPPAGTTIRVSGGVGASISICVCLWTRTCSGYGQRYVFEYGNDCQSVSHIELRGNMTFTAYGHQLASSEGQCALAPRPAHIPAATKECGLTIPTASAP